MNAALGRVVASVPKQKVMDVYDAVKDITDRHWESILHAVVAGLCSLVFAEVALVRIGQGQPHALAEIEGFPRGGAYSGRPTRFNRYAALSAEVDDSEGEEDGSSDEEGAQEISQEDATIFLDSIEECSELASEDSENDRRDGLSDDELTEWLDEEELAQVPWEMGKGCSYYEMEFKHELFVSVDQWMEEVNGSMVWPSGQGLPEKDLQAASGEGEEEFFDLPHDSGSELSLWEAESIIEGFLIGFPRGGAGGASTTSRKRQVGQLVEMLQNWGEEYEASQQQSDDSVKKAVEELKDKMQSWGEAPPSKQEVLTMLQSMISRLQGGKGYDGKGSDGKGASGTGASGKGASSQLHQQSFYEAMKQRQADGPKSKGKGRGRKAKKGMAEGVGDMPTFDVKRAFPGLQFGTWQSANRSLEAAEVPTCNLIQCRDAHQLLLFQDMAKFIKVEEKITIFAVVSQGDPDVPGARKVLLPYLGNLALREAWVASISGQDPGEVGTRPKKTDMKKPQKADTTTLRVNAALDYIQRPLKDEMLKNPSLALGAAGIQECVGEARTFRWTTSQHRMLSGYVSFDSSKVEEVLSHSGRSGIFFQRLAVHVTTPPEVEWISPEAKESNQDYLDRCLAAAQANKTYLTFRRGGGAAIGVVHLEIIDKHRHWALYGLDSSYGPSCVLELLKSLKWEVPHRPSEPNGRNKPWLFYGKLVDPEAGVKTLDHSYELEGDDGVQFLRITAHQRRKKEETEMLDFRPCWWDPTQRFEPEVAATVLEITPDSQEKSSPLKTSPAKKKARTTGFDPSLPGPGQFPMVNLGGSGDCGWRCLACGLAAANTKSWQGDADEEGRFVAKIKQVGGMLRTQAVHSLLSRKDWEAAWAKDDRATELTEDGAVAENIVDFKACLARENRWVCGLTISEISKLKNLNIVIFEFPGKELGWSLPGITILKS